MPPKLHQLAAAAVFALAGACDADFTPEWNVTVDSSPEGGEPEPEAGQEPDANDGMDAAGSELDSGAHDAGPAPGDASVMPVPVLDCSVGTLCSDGGDAGCVTQCIAPCKDTPCAFGVCQVPGDCDVPCGWCLGQIPATK